MENGLDVTTYWLEEVDSTQRYALDAVSQKRHALPFAVAARRQYAGQGSRGTQWTGGEGNLFFSFALERKRLPADLKLESCSIYFSFIFKQVLAEKGSNVWLKWPNDLYLEDRKIGGTITTLRQDVLVCGIGVNLESAPEGSACLDVSINKKMLLNAYFDHLFRFPEWKEIFRFYALEFARSRPFSAHNNSHNFSMKNAVLCEDGAIECGGKRMYSQR